MKRLALLLIFTNLEVMEHEEEYIPGLYFFVTMVENNNVYEQFQSLITRSKLSHIRFKPVHKEEEELLVRTTVLLYRKAQGTFL